MSDDPRRDPNIDPRDRTDPPDPRHDAQTHDRHDDAPLAGADPADDRRSDPVDPVDDRRSDPVDDRRSDPIETETVSSSGVAATSTTDPEAGRDRETHRDPSSQRVAPESSGPGTATDWNAHAGLLPDDDLSGYQRRWDDIQVGFIDEPRRSVREADDLVGEVTHQIADRFTNSRQGLEQRWDGGEEPTTEELRQALQRYRDFFQRLVAR